MTIEQQLNLLEAKCKAFQKYCHGEGCIGCDINPDIFIGHIEKEVDEYNFIADSLVNMQVLDNETLIIQETLEPLGWDGAV